MNEATRTASVIISGSTGVLGSRVSNLIRRTGGVVHPFRGDISSESEVTGFFSTISRVTHVLNCAAVVPLQLAGADPIRTFEVNAIGAGVLSTVTANKFPGSYFLQISSSHVYAPREKPISEEDLTRPGGTYGKSKLAGELLVAAVAEQKELRTGIARVFSMYSEDQDPSFLYPSLRKQLASHEPTAVFRLKGWNNLRDFSSADQIASNVCKLLQLRATGTVNIASGEPLTVGKFAERVAGRSLVFDDTDRELAPNHLVANVEKFMEISGSPASETSG